MLNIGGKANPSYQFHTTISVCQLLAMGSFICTAQGVVAAENVYSTTFQDSTLHDKRATQATSKLPDTSSKKSQGRRTSNTWIRQLFQFSKQVGTRNNFIVYVTVRQYNLMHASILLVIRYVGLSFLQGFDCNLEKCFFPIFLASIARVSCLHRMQPLEVFMTHTGDYPGVLA